MKENLDNNSTDLLTDRELKKILKIDDFKVSKPILDFELLARDINGKIRHFYDEDPLELTLEIGSLKFRRKEVDEFIKNNPDLGKPEPGTTALYRKRLENRLNNILYLERIRDQQLLPPSSYLKKQKSIIKEQIKDSEKVVQKNGFPEDVVNLVKKAKPEIERIYEAIKKVGFSGRLAEAEEKWQQAALRKFKKNEIRFKIITKDHLLDQKLYLLSSSNEKRDFVGGILQKIIDKNYGKTTLLKMYRLK